MKRINFFCCCILYCSFSIAQNVGIGTPSPLVQLHVATPGTGLLLLDNTQTLVTDMADNFYFKTGSWFTGGIKTIGQSTNEARLGFFTYASTGSSGLLERMSITDDGKTGIGITNPLYTLDVTGNAIRTGNFYNTSTAPGHNYGVYASSIFTAGAGFGVIGFGGYAGVEGDANLTPGSGSRYGLKGDAANGSLSNYGIAAYGFGGATSYGVYGNAGGAGINWGGYFSGNVFTNGTYTPSERKLKNDIQPLSDAMSIIDQLKPCVYTFKTSEYEQMHLPEGLQYGLIADEVLQVLPGAVKKAVQPAEYENHDERKGKKLSDEVEFNAINYTEIIPVLIGAVKEQQAMIIDQRKQLELLKTEIDKLKATQKQ